MAPPDASSEPKRGLAGRLTARRLALDLSLDELAGNDLSVEDLRMVEAGLTSPSSDILGILAHRLDTTTDYLTEDVDRIEEKARLTVAYSELALRNGEYQDALAELTELLSDWRILDRETVWRARRLQTQSLEGVGRLEDALIELESLRRDAQGGRRFKDELEIAVDLVRCYQEVGDVSIAIDIGQATLERMSTLHLTGTDEHARLVSALIGAHYERGDIHRAAMLATAAIAEVDAVGSPNARAAIYWNASLTSNAAGDTVGALTLAERAVALLSQGDDSRAIGRLRTAFGWLFLRLDPPDPERAYRELEVARVTLLEVGSAADLAYCETELARCELLRGNPHLALAHAQSATTHSGSPPQADIANVRLIEGHALVALERLDEAVERYSEAMDLLVLGGFSRQSVSIWRELGDTYEHIGLTHEAARAYKVAMLAYQRALNSMGVRADPAQPWARRDV